MESWLQSTLAACPCPPPGQPTTGANEVAPGRKPLEEGVGPGRQDHLWRLGLRKAAWVTARLLLTERVFLQAEEREDRKHSWADFVVPCQGLEP